MASLPSAFAPPTISRISTTSAFIGGLVTVLILSTSLALLMWRRDAVVKVAGIATERGKDVVVGVLKRLGMLREDLLMSERESDAKDLRAEQELEDGEKEQAEVAKEKRPFDFRKRLWHEAPEGRNLENDYIDYEHYDAVQKELKNLGVKNLDWKTNWLNLQIESTLLQDYQDWARRWARRRRRSERFPVEETVFYRGLYESIRMDYFEVLRETQLNDAGYGKISDDSEEMRRFTASVKDRDQSKKSKGERMTPEIP